LSVRWNRHEQAHSGGVETDYEITEAESGEQALEADAKQRPDLILVDIQLPVMDS
jgi:CheY-like chemotaxis protein